MYSVSYLKHDKYGDVISLVMEEGGKYLSPFLAKQECFSLRRYYLSQGLSKVRLLIEGKILTPSQLGFWADEQYKILPKCGDCGVVLVGEVFSHRLSKLDLFCSQKCADRNLADQLDKLNDEVEVEYL